MYPPKFWIHWIHIYHLGCHGVNKMSVRTTQTSWKRIQKGSSIIIRAGTFISLHQRRAPSAMLFMEEQPPPAHADGSGERVARRGIRIASVPGRCASRERMSEKFRGAPRREELGDPQTS